MSGTAVEFTRELVRERVDYELIAHRHTETAREEALEVGLAEVGKTIVLATDRGFVRAVVPASERLDLHKVRELLDTRKATRLATEEELAMAYPMFELGAVPPFGGPPGDCTILDRRLATRESIVVGAGSHEKSVRLWTRDVVRLSDALIADICEE
jgi:Ala-tRNA(Pro) deacylase